MGCSDDMRVNDFIKGEFLIDSDEKDSSKKKSKSSKPK